MEYCYDLLNETFDLPALALEIAQRIKKEASCGIYDCVVSKTTRNGYDFLIEFKTDSGDYITAKFNLMKEYGVRGYYEMMNAMNNRTDERYSVCVSRDGSIHVIGVVR